MKGFTPLVLGLLATLAFSWLGLAYIPDLQIGHLEPQSDEEGTDIYPMPKSGMAERGKRVYVADGCFYCHSQQIRADYAAADVDLQRWAAPSPRPRWGDRRSAPRDYIFDRPAMIGRVRLGPDLANIGKAAPAEEEAAPAQPTPWWKSPAGERCVSPRESFAAGRKCSRTTGGKAAHATVARSGLAASATSSGRIAWWKSRAGECVVTPRECFTTGCKCSRTAGRKAAHATVACSGLVASAICSGGIAWWKSRAGECCVSPREC
ncbi:MAG: hypothetical protein DMF40_07330, partial [Verrucomicrobia bacterium]